MHELAGQPAMARLQEIVQAATDEDRELMRDGLHVGLVVDEHRLDFERGDFLVRNLLGVDQATGSLAIGDSVEVGQTVQFQVRDATAADEDLRCLLAGVGGDAARCCSRATGGARTCSPSPTTTPAVVEELLGPVPARGGVLRRRDRPDRRPEFPARLHRQRRRLRADRRRAVGRRRPAIGR